MKDGKKRRAKALRLPDTAAFEAAAAVSSSTINKVVETDLREVRRHLESTCREAGRETTYSGVFYTYVVRNPKKLAGNTRVLWHGTPLKKNIPGILSRGLTPSWGGLLGPGIYLGGRMKAECFMREKLGALLVCEVALGNCVDAVPRVESIQGLNAYDSIRGVAGATETYGGTLRDDEWVVRDSARISIREIRIFASRAGQCAMCRRMWNLDEMRARWSASGKDYVYVCANCR